jgi:hypothetical protein
MDSVIRTRARARDGRQWLRVFLGGLLLWVATVAVTFWTANANLVPTIILLGSFLVPATFVVYALEHHADQVLTGQRIFTTLLYGGVLGVLGASVLEAEFLKEPSLGTYIGVGLIEEAAKLAALWVVAWRLPRYTMREGIILGAVVGLGFAALERRLRLQRDVHGRGAVAAQPGRDRGPPGRAHPGRARRVDGDPGRGAVPGGRGQGPAAGHRRGGRLVPGGGVAARAVGRRTGDRGLADAAAHRHPGAVAADPTRPVPAADPRPGPGVHRHQLGAAGPGRPARPGPAAGPVAPAQTLG